MKEINQTIWVLTLVVIFTGCRRGSDPLEPSTAPASNLDSLIVTSRKSLTSVEDMGLIQTNEGSRSAIFRPNQAKIPAAFTNYNADGSVRYSIVPEAEENGQVRSAKAYDAAGRMKWQETYAYDQSGNRVRTERNLVDGRRILTQHSYDVTGQAQARRVIGPDGAEVPPAQQKMLLEE